ncbi:hypothetical protein H0H81_003153 [Sphagnurus paluster]|uniref:Amine oxidase n=1 Tax=Sphagnurus paluster TaxID=117069 RepID=A0A9P7KHB3_9AGAR|nr:hypothetical protein H0H81_003153 [Sphagnurus paluster]
MAPLMTLSCLALISAVVQGYAIPNMNQPSERATADRNAKVLILGGGVAGIIAVRTLHEQGINNVVIIEAWDELGRRLKSTTFVGKTVELGANWVQGTQTGNGPKNPILSLVEKHKVKTMPSNTTGSITTYDHTGAVDFLDTFYSSAEAYENLTATAGGRVSRNLVDLTSRAAFNLLGIRPQDARSKATEYYHFDWEYAQKLDQTSAIASSWANNYTFNANEGGFSAENLLSIEQRGFKTFIQEEAMSFLKPEQIRLESLVKNISWSHSGVNVTLDNGESLIGDYAICTFSLGVLQNDDVKFIPSLPVYKQESIASTTMGTYTKIFMHFPYKFWFDTQMGLYADPVHGTYPVWQKFDHEAILPGSKVMVATVTGDFSERIESLTDEQVKQEVMSVLAAMYPNITVPAPLEFMFPRWHSDPLYCGSYSNWPPSFVQQHHDNLRANVGRLYFAGEATSQKYFGEL